jgi:hypothetical protein
MKKQSVLSLENIKKEFAELTKEELLVFIFSQFDNVPERYTIPVRKQMHDFYKQAMA